MQIAFRLGRAAIDKILIWWLTFEVNRNQIVVSVQNNAFEPLVESGRDDLFNIFVCH